jgi:hypothetical protein
MRQMPSQMCFPVVHFRDTVDSRLSAVMVGRFGADNQNQRINRSTHTQARYTGIKLTSLICYAIKPYLSLPFVMQANVLHYKASEVRYIAYYS